MGFNGGGASWASSENDITMNFLTYAALLVRFFQDMFWNVC